MMINKVVFRTLSLNIMNLLLTDLFQLSVVFHIEPVIRFALQNK